MTFVERRLLLLATISMVTACGGPGAASPDRQTAGVAQPSEIRSISAAQLASPATAPVTAQAKPTAALPRTAKAKPSATAGAPDRLLISGVIVTPSESLTGQVLVVGNKITCVAKSCVGANGADGATIVTTGGIVMPGMLDAHNHGLFNIFDEQDWKPTKFYKNHNLWTVEARYKQVVDAKQYLEGKGGVRCELDKYAEVKALISGTTSMVVAPGAQQPACFASVVRTIDTNRNRLGTDKIQSAISVPDETGAKSACKNMVDGKLDAYLVHTAEGVDETSRKEFDRLLGRAGGCLKSSRTTIVHGTALGTPEFTTMAGANMGLVWSPKSNTFLYNDTTKINLAVQAGVKTIAVAPDWALGGSVNMLDELRFADQIDHDKFGDILTPQRLFEMATIDAARALGVANDLGSIEVGKRADLMVVDGSGDPYQALLLAKPETVRLVMVDGRVLYTDEVFAEATPKTPGCEALEVCGAEKLLCIAEDNGADQLSQSYAQVQQALTTALSKYDASVKPPGGALSPLAPLTKCSP